MLPALGAFGNGRLCAPLLAPCNAIDHVERAILGKEQHFDLFIAIDVYSLNAWPVMAG